MRGALRGKGGSILLAVGVFLLVTAALLQFWAYGQLAVAPIDQDSETRLEAQGATVFDTSTLSERTTDLSISARTVGDIAASEDASDEQGDATRVWVSTSSTTDSDGNVLSRSITRSAFGAYDAEAVNCCDEYSETEEGNRESLEHAGLVFKFPFKVEKTTYDFWDGTLQQTVPAEYVREEEKDGMNTYVFEQVIEPTATSTIDLPGDVLGLDTSDTVTADRVYSNTRTFWVEPVTGAVLDRNEQQLTTLQYEGEDRVTLTEADVSYTQASVEETTDGVRSKAFLLRLISPILPIVLSILGVLAIAGGVLLLLRRGSNPPPSRKASKEPEPASA